MIPMRWKIWAFAVVMALVALGAEKDVEKQGDAFQIALPVAALACSLTNGQALGFLARYGVQLVLVHGPKNLLAEAAINQRPNGGFRGLPSGHSATAMLGASNLAFECFRGHPIVQAGAFALAGFVGYSRVEADAHYPWQVLAGFLIGFVCDRAFRRRATLQGLFNWNRRGD